ncbi:Uncharacterized protein HSBGL_0866 [Halapricum desulfuricans]|uniref:Envelope protein N-terminal domain-containing protein n=1 Tax=Halapricum desulfuricans TaxID=2841257 RepID=A0A897NM54_9EURY|nr:hypothetical protein [Halapricum desulfuricans]QSG11296.1 Uncharacterized protein HSBGL_0866 [Halapricum desulfuricans]
MKRIFTLALLLAVVVTPITGPLAMSVSPVESAAAEETQDDCGVLEMISPGGCSPATYGDETQQEIDAAQDHLALYQEGRAMITQSKSFTDVMSNYITDTEDTAWLLAEQAVAEAYQNGSTEAEAKIAAKERVREYYATKQKNHLNAWENHIAAMQSMLNQTSTFTSDPTDLLYLGMGDVKFSTSAADEKVDSYTNLQVQTTDVTLVSGETVQTKQLQATLKVGGSSYGSATFDPISGVDAVAGPDDWGIIYADAFPEVNLRPSESDSDTYAHTPYMWPPRWRDPMTKLDATYSEVENETNTFVSNTYTDFQTDKINATDLLSKVNLMNNYQLDATGGNATFNDVVSALAASGMSTTDLGNTSYMGISYEPNHITNTTITRDGMLLSGSAPPNGSWEIGTEYHSDNITGSQSVATLDGDMHIINGTFTINEVYDSAGNPIDQVTIDSPDRDYSVTNTTETQELIVELGEEIDRLEDMKTDDSGAGGTGDSGVDASGFFQSVEDALTGLFGFAGSGLSGAIQGLMIVFGGLIALSILLNSLLP